MTDQQFSDRFYQLVDRYCAATNTAEEAAELEAMLRADREAERYFLDHCHLQTQLFQQHTSDKAIEVGLQTADDDAATPVSRLERAWDHVRSTLANHLAASLIVAGLFMAIILLSMKLIVPDWGRPAVVDTDETPPIEFVARIVKTKNARWSPDTEVRDRRTTDLFARESISLESGIAEILFDSGARVILEGPARLRPLSDLEAELSSGKLCARVPAEAVGFTVHTELITVVDLGTEFALDVSSKTTELHVFEGSTQVAPSSTKEQLVVSAGEAVHFTTGDSSELQRTPISLGRRFIRKLEPSTTIFRLLGADSGEGLDLDGDLVHAINFGGPSTQVGSVEFKAVDDVAGLQVTATQEPFTWDVPIGDSHADQGLSEVLGSLLFSTAPSSVVVSLPVTAGDEYHLQLLFLEGLHRNRDFRIAVNEKTIVPRLTLKPGKGVVVNHRFLAESDLLVIEHAALQVSSDRDPNPILPALVLDKIAANDSVE